MLTQKITYTDLAGNERSRDFYFNVSKADLAKIEIEHDGGFNDYLKRIVDDNNGKEIVKVVTELIELSYGIKTADNFFVKDKLEYQKFAGSEAYSVFFMSLVTDAGACSDFVNGIMPQDMVEAAKKNKAAHGFRPGAETLPQSRRDQIERERLAAEPVVVEEESETAPAETEDEMRARIRREIAAENAAENAAVDPTTAYANSVIDERVRVVFPAGEKYPPTYQAPLVPTTPTLGTQQ